MIFSLRYFDQSSPIYYWSMIINRYLWWRQTELVSLFKDFKKSTPWLHIIPWLTFKWQVHATYNNSSYQVSIDYHQSFYQSFRVLLLKHYNKWTVMRQGSVGGRPYLKTDTSSFEPSPTWPIKIHNILIVLASQ